MLNHYRTLVHLIVVICSLNACSTDNSSAKETQLADDTPTSSALSATVHADVPGYASFVELTPRNSDSYAWEMLSAPPQSALTSNHLQGKKYPIVSFVADAAGDYVLRATVKRAGETTSIDVSVTVQGYDIPFIASSLNGVLEGSKVAMVVDSGGGEARVIGCEYVKTFESGADWADNNSSGRQRIATYLPQALGQSALIASRIYSDDEDLHGRIEIAQSTTDCDINRPALIEGVTTPMALITVPYKFSPDGSKLLAADNGEPEDQLISIASDGSSQTVLYRTDGPAPNCSQLAWVNNQTAAWVGQDEDDNRLLYTTPTRAAGALSSHHKPLIDCTDSTGSPLFVTTQLEFSQNGIVLENYGHLVRLDKDERGRFDCGSEAPTNHVISGDHVISDFRLAPHREGVADRVAFSSEGAIYVVMLDGSNDPVRYSFDNVGVCGGAQWAMGGRQLIWTCTTTEEVTTGEGFSESMLHRPVVTRIYRANADGTHRVVVWSNEASEDTAMEVITGSGNGSSCNAGFAQSDFVWGAVGLSLLLFRRRLLHHTA